MADPLDYPNSEAEIVEEALASIEHNKKDIRKGKRTLTEARNVVRDMKTNRSGYSQESGSRPRTSGARPDTRGRNLTCFKCGQKKSLIP